MGIFAPVITHADIIDDISAQISNGANDTWGAVKDAGVAVVGYAGKFVVGICMALESIGADLLNNTLDSSMLQQAVTKDPNVIIGWTAVRDFANMFIVLGFVIIAISLILRIGEYGSTKTLFTLIIVALLINFSLLICGIIIDGANITMNYFLSPPLSVGPSGLTTLLGGSAATPQIYVSIDASLHANNGAPSWTAFAALVTGACLYSIIAAMLFIIYAALFLFRQAALMCLVILSPLAFVCYVFPATKQIWQKWWSQFTQWAIVGIPACFFIWLGTKIVANPNFGNTALVAGQPPPSALSFFIPAAFMYFAYTLTFQISAIGAAGAIGLATGAMGVAMGATKVGGRALGGMADRATGNRISGAGNAVKSGFTRVGESLGIVKEGTTAQNQLQRRSEAKTTMENLRNSSSLGDRAKYENYVRNGRGAKGAAAVALANENGDFGRIMGNNVNAMHGRAAYAQQFGYRPEDFEKKMPSYAANNQQTINRLTNTKNPITGANYNVTDAQREAVRQKHAGMSGTNIKELHHSQMTQHFAEDVNSRALDRASLDFNADQRNTLKAMIPDLTARRATLNGQVAATAAGSPARAALQRQLDNLDRNIATISHPNF